MKVQVNQNYTGRVVDALVDAGNFRYDWEYHNKVGQKVYFCQGYKFTSTKKFCEFMISEMEDWMYDNGLVDIDKLQSATYSSTLGACFTIS